MNIMGLLGGAPWSADPDRNQAVDRAMTMLGAGLLSGAGSGQNFSSILGQSMAGAQNAYDSGMTDALKRRLLQSQMDETAAQAAQRKQMIEDAQRKAAAAEQQARGRMDLAASIAARGQPGFRDASIAMGGTAPAGYVPPEQRAGLTRADMAAWIAQGGDPKQLEAIMSAPDLGMPEVARTIEGRGADNMPQTVQYDKFGRPVGGAIPKAVEMRMQDTGGSIVPVNPFAPIALTKTMTPGDIQQAADAAAGRSVTIRGQNLTDARAREGMTRPIWSNEAGAFVFPPSKESPTGTFVQPVGAGGAPLPPKAADLAKIETDLRKEFSDLPQTKKYAQAVPAYRAIADATTRNNKQADINLVYGLAKLYDPESVVREGEYDTIASSQTIPEWLKGAAASLTGTGGRLTPATRAQILTEARGRLSSYETEFNSARAAYERIAQQRGANPQNVVVPIGAGLSRDNPRQSTSFQMLPNAREFDGKTVRDTVSGKRYKSEAGKWVEVQ